MSDVRQNLCLLLSKGIEIYNVPSFSVRWETSDLDWKLSLKNGTLFHCQNSCLFPWYRDLLIMHPSRLHHFLSIFRDFHISASHWHLLITNTVIRGMLFSSCKFNHLIKILLRNDTNISWHRWTCHKTRSLRALTTWKEITNVSSMTCFCWLQFKDWMKWILSQLKHGLAKWINKKCDT